MPRFFMNRLASFIRQLAAGLGELPAMAKLHLLKGGSGDEAALK
jgi:hypothetical protein